ncbi:MAG TPA: ROK family protein [Aeromicrobium sp.]|nr:ROK family protein [Aeromicrobium sp.]
MSDELAIGVDIGGTKIAAGVVDRAGHILTRRLVPTATQSTDALVDAIVAVARDLAAEAQVAAVGIGVAGLVDPTRSVVRSSSHLPLRDEPLRDRIATALGLPVMLDNDAHVGGLAELSLGAARGAEHALLVTVGTGIGGAVIINGRVHRGWQGEAGEIGHLIVERDGRHCPCGSRGCWEQYASGRALMRAAAAAGLDAEHGSAVTAAASAGNPQAQAVFCEIGRWLGIGIASLVAVLDPEVVVVGGGVSSAGDHLLKPAGEAFRTYLTAAGTRPEPRIVRASFGPDAGVIGAAELARMVL